MSQVNPKTGLLPDKIWTSSFQQCMCPNCKMIHEAHVDKLEKLEEEMIQDFYKKMRAWRSLFLLKKDCSYCVKDKNKSCESSK